METGSVTPAHLLHRELERARSAGEERTSILDSVLHSGNLAVIRRIPELLLPLTADELEMIARWADGLMASNDVVRQADGIRRRDFAFHLMVNCGVPTDQILKMLERYRAFSRSVLDHIRQEAITEEGLTKRLNGYLRSVAEELLGGTEIPARDRGRHMLVTLAQTPTDWQDLAERFSEREIADLRQGVLTRFLEECSNETALARFADNVVAMCRTNIQNALLVNVHEEASHMHWVLMCLERLGRQREVEEFAAQLRSKFDADLPLSVQDRIYQLTGLPPIYYADRRFPTPVAEPKPDVPLRKEKEPEPYSVDDAIRRGWTIRLQSGRQVVLVKDGRSVTRYTS